MSEVVMNVYWSMSTCLTIAKATELMAVAAWLDHPCRQTERELRIAADARQRLRKLFNGQTRLALSGPGGHTSQVNRPHQTMPAPIL